MSLPVSISSNSIKTTCPYCGVGCGVIASINEQDEIIIKGDKDHPANFGRLCSKGSALDETVDISDRLLYPKIKQQRVEWNQALDTVANGFKKSIKEYGAESVAFYVSGQLLTEDYYVANKLMKGFIGTANIDTNSRLCMSSAVAGHKRAFGSDTVAMCYEDLEEAELIVLIGSNIAWCHPVLYQRIDKAKQKSNIKIIVVDPRRTSSCDIADQHLQIKPGTDAMLFNGLLTYLDQNNLLDNEYIQSHTNGFNEALNTARQTAPNVKHVSGYCQIDEQQLTDFYDLFTNNNKVISLFSMGINQSSSGVDKVNSIINVHLATGKIGKPGSGAFSITGQPNAMGGREVGGLASTLAAHMSFDESDRRCVKKFWQSPEIAKAPGLKAVDLFREVYAGKIKALWIMATNPVVSLPDADLVKEALKKCDLVVVSDVIEKTDTTRYADILLPAQAWAEKSGTVTNSERRISRQRAFLNAAGESKPDWWIISEVAKRMGFTNEFEYKNVAEIFREHAGLSAFENDGKRDFDLGALVEISNKEYDLLQPIQWPVNSENIKGTKRLFEDGRYFTPDNKARFIPIEPRLPKESISNKYPLILNTGRVRDQWHTMTRTGKSQRLSRHIKEPYVQIHPDTARKFHIENSRIVEITSEWGKVLLRADVTDRQRQGEVFIPLHWNDQFSAKARVDAIVNPHVDPISGQPEYKHTPVSICPVNHNWFGFMLTRSELDISLFNYWSKYREKDNWHYEFSDENVYEQDWIKNIVISDDKYEWLELNNELNETTRYFWFDHSGLQGCVFTSKCIDLLNGRDWFSEQFTKLSVDMKQRYKIVSGLMGQDNIDQGPVVCSCFNVGQKTIRDFILKTNPENINLIGKKLKAGTNCGSCRPELKSLLQESLSI